MPQHPGPAVTTPTVLQRHCAGEASQPAYPAELSGEPISRTTVWAALSASAWWCTQLALTTQSGTPKASLCVVACFAFESVLLGGQLQLRSTVLNAQTNNLDDVVHLR